MSEQTEIEAGLRAWAREVEAHRRPVDVDAIVDGAVMVAPRRGGGRHLPLLALVGVVAVLAFTAVAIVIRDATHIVETVMPADLTSPTTVLQFRPAPSPKAFDTSGATFVRTSVDGRATVAVTWVPALPEDTPCDAPLKVICVGPWVDVVVAYDGTYVGEERSPWRVTDPGTPLRSAGPDGNWSGQDDQAPRLFVKFFQARSEVAKVSMPIRQADGSIAIDTMEPRDGIVVFAGLGGATFVAGGATAYDAEGNIIAQT